MIFLFLFVWNLFVFLLYGYDKRQARKKKWRISEKTLLLTSLLAGGIPSLLAGKIFHHKTKKGYFWFCWLVGSGVEIGVILWIRRIYGGTIHF